MGVFFLPKKKKTTANKKEVYIIKKTFTDEKKLIDLLKEYISYKIKSN